MDTEINSIAKTDDVYQYSVKVLKERIEAISSVDAAGDSVSREALEFEQGKRIDARAMLMDQFGIDSAFVRVPILARVLNLAPAGIYAAIRANRFFIPHRMMFSAPAVKLDDLVEWYCADETSDQSARKRLSQGALQCSDAESFAVLAPNENASSGVDDREAPEKSIEKPSTKYGPQNISKSTGGIWQDEFAEDEAARLKRDKQAIIKTVKARMKAVRSHPTGELAPSGGMVQDGNI